MLHLAGLDGEYHRVKADTDVLVEVVEGMRHGRWDGLNITMPLKAEAARLADSLSPQASRSGSVNTLTLDGSEVHGETTDSTAFHELFTSDRFSEIRSILVLGAGGTAAAALTAAPDEANVYLSSRRPRKAEELAGRLGGQVVSWGTGVAGALVVNSTPLGMDGEQLPDGILAVAAGLVDLPYGVDTTPAIEAGVDLGIPQSDGHEFLLRQAIASFTLWTDTRIEFDVLEEHLRNG